MLIWGEVRLKKYMLRVRINGIFLGERECGVGGERYIYYVREGIEGVRFLKT